MNPIPDRPIAERIAWLFELARRHGEAFRSPDAWLARQRYLAEHPTAIAVMKCMDGRINIPVATRMPAGIVITRVAPVQMKADRIAWACYQITYPAEAAAVLDQYNALESAPVEKHGKKGNKIIELKQHIPQVAYTAEGDAVRIELCLPASQELNLNPSLLTGFLEEKFGLPAASAGILRTKFLTEDKQLFA